MRFPRFEGEWEEKKLGDVAKFSKGKGISKSDIEEGGTIECIRYGELYTHYKEVIIEVKSRTNVDKSNLVFSEANDVIIPSSGETQIDIATASCVLNSGVALGGDLNIIKTDNNGVFLSYYLNSKKKMEIANLAQGISVVHLYSSQLASLKMNFPCLAEQDKIASFLSLLNERIQTQNKIIDSLETLIKGLSEKLFAPKIRFKDEQENDFADWLENFGDSLFESISNKNHNSDLPILAITQEHGAIPRDMIDYNVSVSDKSIESYKVVQKGDFIISLRSFQGGIEFSNYEGICSPAYIVLRPIKEVNRNFFRLYFKTTGYIKRLIKNLEGIRDGKMISFKYFSEVTIPTPSIEEQKKITNFLLSIERKIETERKVLAQYENQKSYLLQHMFI
ncbi:restriction endonuclease subunit S [Flavipsychrobacter stenotrophus]|uniref:Restriction endonuclease subunit S n=1 Tax=Flavipsychrobacter stenotrophus TaxID=2077091 RepID=A0A2S7SPI6_9BACT|nr:restriction endonuclease subunit S [Flavipsychrobacter stenotrophus]PQJ08800.1 restriction endonuclease subunit S [Flavipsychrobacter stenotrophus]